MIILAIETSCDETAIAIVEVKKIDKKDTFTILADNLNSQVKLHAEYGGVFPTIAKREHQKNLPLLLEKSLKQAKIKMEEIDRIAVTVGPGLEPALWTGIVFAEELSEKYKKKVIPVNHMEGHIFSIFPKNKKTFQIDTREKIFPIISLLVSGGHTEIILMKNWPARHRLRSGVAGGGDYKILGQTRDDAAGEAFDKVARMLGLPYPGGPAISVLASKARQKQLRIKNYELRIKFPRPMIHSKDYDFSFSGLKTAVLYYIRDLNHPSAPRQAQGTSPSQGRNKNKETSVVMSDKLKQQIAREFEDAVVDVLVSKTLRALKEYKAKTLIVGGGVSANKYLQSQMKKKINLPEMRSKAGKVKVHFPSNSLTGDNALMIAIAGYFSKNKKQSKIPLKASGNLKL